jgi:hypothetical protein
LSKTVQKIGKVLAKSQTKYQNVEYYSGNIFTQQDLNGNFRLFHYFNEIAILRLTNGNCSPLYSGGLGYARLGRSLRSLPHLTPPHFGSPANLRFAYLGWQNVSYLERYAQYCKYFIKKINYYEIMDNNIPYISKIIPIIISLASPD